MTPQDIKREKRLRDIDCHETELLTQVSYYLEELTDDMTPADNYCARENENNPFTNQRLLSMLGQCANMNRFVFPLHVDADIENWFRLYASAIRCSVEPCERGWVFLEWRYHVTPEERRAKQRSWAHATALYLDVPSRRQVFFDPSRCLDSTVSGNVLEHFQNNHMWLSDDDEPDLVVSRAHGHRYPCVLDPVDNEDAFGLLVLDDVPPPMQTYFCNPVRRADEKVRLNGCCTTMVVLIVWLCVRFGCRDVQLMVDAVRCAMRAKRRQLLEQDPCAAVANLNDFLLRLRAWHNGLNDRSMTVDALHRWLKIKRTPGSDTCHYMEYNDDGTLKGLCAYQCWGGTTWCAQHALVLPGRVDLDDIPPTEIRIMELANGLAGTKVVVGGYFERRWRSDRWACALDTMRLQTLRAEPFADGERTLATVRFYGFLHKGVLQHEDIRYILRAVSWSKLLPKANVLSAELLIPEADGFRLSAADAFRFTALVGQAAPLLWFASAVVAVRRTVRVLACRLGPATPPGYLEAAFARHRLRDGAHAVVAVTDREHAAWLPVVAAAFPDVGFHVACSASHAAYWAGHRDFLVAQLSRLAERIAGPTFPTPWCNAGGVPPLTGHHLYLTVIDRPQVPAPDGRTLAWAGGPILVYAEGFLADWLVSQWTPPRSRDPDPTNPKRARL